MLQTRLSSRSSPISISHFPPTEDLLSLCRTSAFIGAVATCVLYCKITLNLSTHGRPLLPHYGGQARLGSSSVDHPHVCLLLHPHQPTLIPCLAQRSPRCWDLLHRSYADWCGVLFIAHVVMCMLPLSVIPFITSLSSISHCLIYSIYIRHSRDTYLSPLYTDWGEWMLSHWLLQVTDCSDEFSIYWEQLEGHSVWYGSGECLICSISATALYINRPNLI